MRVLVVSRPALYQAKRKAEPGAPVDLAVRTTERLSPLR
jgi:hypothetical protein